MDPVFRRKRTEQIALGLLIVAVMSLYAALLTNAVEPSGTDWAMYVMHARNLVTGRPYGDTFFVYQPETSLYGSSTYPTGFSLLLAPVYALFGLNLRAFKLVTDLVLALSLWPIYYFFRRYLGALESLLLVAALGFSAPYLGLQDRINSDSLYQLLSFSALVFLLRVYDTKQDRSAPWRSGVLAGLLLTAVEITRPIGMALILATVAFDLVMRRRLTRFLAAMLATLVPLLALNGALAHKDSGYAEQFVLSIRNAASNLAYYAGTGLSGLFANPASHWLRYALWLLAWLLVLAGLATNRRLATLLPAAYVALTLGVLGLYWAPNPRYLAPLYPFFLLFAAFGWLELRRRVPASWTRPAAAAAALALLAAPMINAAATRPLRSTLITNPDFRQLAAALDTASTDRDLVVFWNARVLALAASRHASTYPGATEVDNGKHVTGETVLRYLDRIHPSLVVLDGDPPQQDRYLAEAMALAPDRFQLIYRNTRFQLFRYAPPSR